MQDTQTNINLAQAKDHIINWLKEYAQNAGVRGFVVGVSGGVDSGLVSTLCAETGLKVLCVEMPIHQNSQHASRAAKHVEWLKSNYNHNVAGIEVDLTAAFDQFMNTNAPNLGFDQNLIQLAGANTRSRLRMVNLYLVAQLNGLLVCGTGNKVEDFGVGFYTKYGDGGVDISPIADLMKTEVWAMAEMLGVSQEIVEAVPSDGLWGDTRSDEDQIGASYPELEWAMNYLEKNPYYTVEDLNKLEEREQEVLKIYKGFNGRNQHKMNPIPVCDVSQFRE